MIKIMNILMVLFFASISSASAFAGYYYHVNRGFHVWNKIKEK